MNARDHHVIQQAAEAARRQAELEGRFRDGSAYVPPLGANGDSIRSYRGFEGISDEMLRERANFSLQAHMAGVKPAEPKVLDLAAMSPEELRGLAQAAATELESREED